MNRRESQLTNTSAGLTIVNSAKVGRGWILLFSAWLVCGVTCVALDADFQPAITRLGRDGIFRQVAEHWQELGGKVGIVLFLAASLLNRSSTRRRTVARFAVTVLLAGATVQLLKNLVGRARPNWVNDATVFYGPWGLFNEGPTVPIDSMPSGHTTAAFAMAAALSLRWPKATLLWFALSLGVGISRTLVDRHFPSDVILGALLGTLVAVIVARWLPTASEPSPGVTKQPIVQTTSDTITCESPLCDEFIIESYPP